MYDMCFLRYKKLAQVGSVSIVDQEVAYLLVQSPSDMTYALTVNIGVELPDKSVRLYQAQRFEVIDPHLVKAYLPTPLLTTYRTAPITVVEVYVDTPVSSESDDLEFAVTHDMRDGAAKLIQTFIKLLMGSPGSDKFDMDAGGGLLRGIRGVSLDQPAMVAGVVTGAVKRTAKQIMTDQSNMRLTAEETLVSAQVLEVTTDKTTLSVIISLLILSRGGAARVAFSTTTGSA